MKRLLFLTMIALMAASVTAQPKQSRLQQNAAKQTKNTTANQGMTQRMQIMYPVAVDMPEDVVWRRDIYREIDLTEESNSGLYYPVVPQGKQMNLFTYIFKLALNNYIPIYEYSIANDGNDDFSEEAKVKLTTVLYDHHIPYTEENGKVRVENNHIPSQEVTKYYLKESAYYDQSNATFHIKVLALCPIMGDSDFGAEPLFWVKYSDLEPFLSRQQVMTSDRNNAATMSLDDFFTLNKYKGKIYKTNNMLGKTLTQIVGEDSVKLSEEQRRIEKELETFRNNLFGDKQKRDSLDSIASADPKAAKKIKAKESKKDKGTATAKPKKSKPSSTRSSGGPVSVRRQRH